MNRRSLRSCGYRQQRCIMSSVAEWLKVPVLKPPALLKWDGQSSHGSVRTLGGVRLRTLRTPYSEKNGLLGQAVRDHCSQTVAKPADRGRSWRTLAELRRRLLARKINDIGRQWTRLDSAPIVLTCRRSLVQVQVRPL